MECLLTFPTMSLQHHRPPFIKVNTVVLHPIGAIKTFGIMSSLSQLLLFCDYLEKCLYTPCLSLLGMQTDCSAGNWHTLVDFMRLKRLSCRWCQSSEQIFGSNTRLTNCFTNIINRTVSTTSLCPVQLTLLLKIKSQWCTRLKRLSSASC